MNIEHYIHRHAERLLGHPVPSAGALTSEQLGRLEPLVRALKDGESQMLIGVRSVAAVAADWMRDRREVMLRAERAGFERASWHERLGVDASATAEQIETAFRRLAMEHHPDRGGDPTYMTHINAARAEGLALRAAS